MGRSSGRSRSERICIDNTSIELYACMYSTSVYGDRDNYITKLPFM